MDHQSQDICMLARQEDENDEENEEEVSCQCDQL